MARFSGFTTGSSIFITSSPGSTTPFAIGGRLCPLLTADVKRYFAGHRLEMRPVARARSRHFGSRRLGRRARQLEAYYLNPFLPFYWEQLNADRDDNPLWSFDASYLIPRGPLLYGEFLIDDFQIDFKSEPHQVGWLLGFNWSRPAGLRNSYVTFDWTHIEPGVYGQPQPYNRYINHRVVMGSDIGNDAERVYRAGAST